MNSWPLWKRGAACCSRCSFCPHLQRAKQKAGEGACMSECYAVPIWQPWMSTASQIPMWKREISAPTLRKHRHAVNKHLLGIQKKSEKTKRAKEKELRFGREVPWTVLRGGEWVGETVKREREKKRIVTYKKTKKNSVRPTSFLWCVSASHSLICASPLISHYFSHIMY